MILNAIIDDQIYTLNVPDEIITDASNFFDRMDSDMNQGVQMSREWIENPDRIQRCQVAADKLLTALENENHNLGRLMAGYILARMPDIDSVQIDTSGDMTATILKLKGNGAAATQAAPSQDIAMDDTEALAQAEQDISQVFKGGKQWKFSTFNAAQGVWSDSPAFADQATAETARKAALVKRYRELTGQ